MEGKKNTYSWLGLGQGLSLGHRAHFPFPLDMLLSHAQVPEYRHLVIKTNNMASYHRTRSRTIKRPYNVLIVGPELKFRSRLSSYYVNAK